MIFWGGKDNRVYAAPGCSLQFVVDKKFVFPICCRKYIFIDPRTFTADAYSYVERARHSCAPSGAFVAAVLYGAGIYVQCAPSTSFVAFYNGGAFRGKNKNSCAVERTVSFDSIAFV